MRHVGKRAGTARLGDGRYRLLEQLGSGGMSVVWRAHDDLLDRPVAIKMLASKLATDTAFRQRIRVEARAAAALGHPHITAVYDYGESEIPGDLTVPFVVMELVDGEPLANRLHRTGPLRWEAAVTTAAEVAAALATAHARGVVHRDVTAHNVMLTGNGAKVVDFGISALVGQRDSTADGSLLGTPAYLAPERLTGGPVSPAADVYALGMLLYRSLTGRLPWPAESTAAVLRAHLYTDAAPLPPFDDLPAIVADLTLRCLAKNPAERPTSADVARGLSAAVGLVPVLPVPTTATSRWANDVRPGSDRAQIPSRGPAEPTGRRPGAGRAGTRRPPAPPGRAARRPVAWPPASAVRTGRSIRAAATTLGLFLAAGLGWGISEHTGQAPTAPAAASDEPVGAAPAADQGGDDGGCRVRYHVRRDSGTGFDASVTVTNNGADPLTGWQLGFSLRGDQQVLTASPASADQAGRAIVVRAADVLAPGESANLLLSGRYKKSNPLPTGFTVDGRHCASTVSTVGVDTDAGTVSAAEDEAPSRTAKKRTAPASGSGKKARGSRVTTDSSGSAASSGFSGSGASSPTSGGSGPASARTPKSAKPGVESKSSGPGRRASGFGVSV